MSKDTKNSQTAVFALAKRGAGAKPLQEKNDVILRSARRPRGDEGSRAAPIYKGGAVSVRSGLMCIIVKLKSKVVVRTFER